MQRYHGTERLSRRPLEVCILSSLAQELKAGDVAVKGSEQYADYRDQLLSVEECKPLVDDYCGALGLPTTAQELVVRLTDALRETAATVDAGYPANDQVVIIPENGPPVLKRLPHPLVQPAVSALEEQLRARMPERSVLDVLARSHYWAQWSRHFGPLSGSEPKLDDPTTRYLLTTFTYGCNLGPAQAARHLRPAVTAHMLSFVNRRHVTAQKLETASRDLINAYHQLDLPKLWGTGRHAAADGTKFALYEENLVSAYHIRYGGYGGIAYHHVSDTYVALFSHFIPCGVWEAVYILEGLLKNPSRIQPDTLHADTQGQSTPVFTLAYLLGIQLMPRIRNWQDLVFYRPHKNTRYTHIDPLFGDPIDWTVIETHWSDVLRVVLSIQAGKISSATLLRKLGNYSRKNRLYQAFRELGRVVRTLFLLRYISDLPLRQQITASTNKAEAYNGFSKWLFFGGEGVIAENDPEEQEKAIKYNDLVANAVVLSNVVDMTQCLEELVREGYPVHREDVAALSLYLTYHIKRFGDYIVDWDRTPDPLDIACHLILSDP